MILLVVQGEQPDSVSRLLFVWCVCAVGTLLRLGARIEVGNQKRCSVLAAIVVRQEPLGHYCRSEG